MELPTFFVMRDTEAYGKHRPLDDIISHTSSLTIMGRNKQRIYLALYTRTGQRSDIPHVALLLCPKKTNQADTNTWRFHAMNRPNTDFTTQQEWQYDGTTTHGRTNRMMALVLLGKTENDGEHLNEILSQVEMVQDDPSWSCKEWVFSAIEVSGPSYFECDGLCSTRS